MPALKTTSKKYLAEVMTQFESFLEDGSLFAGCASIGAELGLEWQEGKLKKVGRIMEKVIIHDGRFDKIRDYARGMFLVDNLCDIARVVERIESGEEYTVVRVKNRFAPGYDAKQESSGYRDYQMLAMVEGGWIFEIQVIPRAFYEVKAKLGAVKASGAVNFTGQEAYKEYRAIRESRLRYYRDQSQSERGACASVNLGGSERAGHRVLADDVQRSPRRNSAPQIFFNQATPTEALTI